MLPKNLYLKLCVILNETKIAKDTCLVYYLIDIHSIILNDHMLNEYNFINLDKLLKEKYAFCNSFAVAFFFWQRLCICFRSKYK